MIPTPLELLQKQLTDLERNLEKSEEMHLNDEIDFYLRQTHVRNLAPKIRKYQQAIKILTNHDERNTITQAKERS